MLRGKYLTAGEVNDGPAAPPDEDTADMTDTVMDW